MTIQSDDGQAVALSYYSRVVRRRWYVVVLGLLIAIGGGLAYLSTSAKTATATASVNINAISSQPFDNSKPESQLIDPKTETALARSAHVLSSAAKTIGMPSASLSYMRSHTAVQSVTNATIVKISFSSTTRKRAVSGANAVAREYLAYRSKLAADKVETVVSQLNARRDSLKQDLDAANRRIARAKSGSQIAAQASSDRQLINIQLTAIVGQINQLDSVDTTGGAIVSPADSSAVGISPSRATVLIPAGLVGIILGLVATFIVNAADRRVEDSHALTQAGGGSVLSRLPGRQARIPATSADMDAVRALRERLLAAVPEGANLVVADLTKGNHPSDVAVNLAIALTEGQRLVRLVLPQHNVSEFVERIVTTLDLAIDKRSPLGNTYLSRRIGTLHVVVSSGGAGDQEPFATDLGALLANHDVDYFMTVVALPPDASRSLRLSAGRLAQSIILVANRRGTTTMAVRDLSEELAAVGATVHGSVLVPKHRSLPYGKRDASAVVSDTEDIGTASGVTPTERGTGSTELPITRQPPA